MPLPSPVSTTTSDAPAPGPAVEAVGLLKETYALDGVRRAIMEGDGLASMGRDLALLAVIGLVCIPVGLALFGAGERYAKRHGKLKRSG